jgi:LysM repeat protein
VFSGQHRVEDGETLRRIAQRYGVAADDLARSNQISDSGALAVGTVLAVPAASAAGCSCLEPAAPREAPATCEATPAPVASAAPARPTERRPAAEDPADGGEPFRAIDEVLALGDSYLDSARFEESIDLAELGLGLLGRHWTRADAGPRIARAELMRGIAQMALDRSLESEASFRRALRVEPEIALGPEASPKLRDAFEAVRSEVQASLADPE